MKKEIRNLKIQFGIGIFGIVLLTTGLIFGFITLGVVPIISILSLIIITITIRSDIRGMIFMQEMKDIIEQCHKEIDELKEDESKF